MLNLTLSLFVDPNKVICTCKMVLGLRFCLQNPEKGITIGDLQKAAAERLDELDEENAEDVSHIVFRTPALHNYRNKR